MTGRGKEVLDEALRLSKRQRARLGAELLASLEPAPTPESEAAWAEELERRARQAVAGKSAGRAWSEVRERLRRSARAK